MLVTQPKIAAPCEDGPAIQQNARSGSAGTVSQPTQDWRQIESLFVSRSSVGLSAGV
jgi:hypothetical protein